MHNSDTMPVSSPRPRFYLYLFASLAQLVLFALIVADRVFNFEAAWLYPIMAFTGFVGLMKIFVRRGYAFDDEIRITLAVLSGLACVYAILQ